MEIRHKRATLLTKTHAMKTTPILLLAAALIAGGCQSAQTSAAPAKPDNVTVEFQDADKFTDLRESFGSESSPHYLGVLRDHLQKEAVRYLAPGQKLAVTFTDVDLAGDFLPTSSRMQDVRIVKDVYLPRMALTFQLTDADGKVLKEGERRLTDLNFMNNLSIVDRNEALFYDKALLTDWMRKEFRS